MQSVKSNLAKCSFSCCDGAEHRMGSGLVDCWVRAGLRVHKGREDEYECVALGVNNEGDLDELEYAAPD